MASREPSESALTSGHGCRGVERIRLRLLAPAPVSGSPIFESTLVASHRYPRFHADRFNSNIGLPIPSAKPWQNAAKVRSRRLSDPRTVLLSVRFTSSNPCNRKIQQARFRHLDMLSRTRRHSCSWIATLMRRERRRRGLTSGLRRIVMSGWAAWVPGDWPFKFCLAISLRESLLQIRQIALDLS